MKYLLTAAFALAPAALLAQTAPNETRITGTRLDIVATGEAHRTPDIATISAGVVTQGGNAGKAMADNATRMTATIEALKRAGIAPRDIQTQSLRLAPQYRYIDNQPPVLTGYQANNQVSVRLRDLARAGAVLDALVAAGANQINGPDLSVDKPEVAMDEARTDALAQARARADLYAKAAGMRVVKIVRISESGSIERTMNDIVVTAMRKSAATPIEAGEQTLAVTINVTFDLQ